MTSDVMPSNGVIATATQCHSSLVIGGIWYFSDTVLSFSVCCHGCYQTPSLALPLSKPNPLVQSS